MYIKQSNKIAVQSQIMISNALIELLKTESYASITISEICRKAEVVRKTFYRNFNTKEDIFHFMIDNEFDRFKYKVDINGNIYEAFLELYNYILQYKKGLRIILKAGFMHFLRNKLSEYINETEFFNNLADSFKNELYREYLVNHISATVCTLVSVWVKSSFSESPEVLAELTEKLFRQPIFRKY